MDWSALWIWLVFSASLGVPTAVLYKVTGNREVVGVWVVFVGATWIIAFSMTLGSVAP